MIRPNRPESLFAFAKHALKVSVFLTVALLVRLCVRKGAGRDVLVLRLDGLGDLFVWLSGGAVDVAQFCREQGGRSTIMIRTEFSEFIATLGLFDEVMPFDVRRFADLRGCGAALAALRRHGFSQVLQVRAARQILVEDMIVLALGVKAASPVGDRRGLAVWEAWLTDRLYTPIVALVGCSPEIETNHRITAALVGHKVRRFDLPAAELPQIANLPSTYFVVAHGAGAPIRQWPAEKFIAAATDLPIPCVVVGTCDEVTIGDEIAGALGGLNLCGKLSILELTELVRRARFVLCNESGLSHIAAYVRVPSVVILGGGHFGQFVPYPQDCDDLLAPTPVYSRMDCFGCSWRCPYVPGDRKLAPCIAHVEVGVVRRAIDRVMAGTQQQ